MVIKTNTKAIQEVGLRKTIRFLMILFNDRSNFYVTSSYYDTSSLATFINQASQYKPQIFKGVSIIVVMATNLALQVIFLFRFRKWFVENSVAY